MRCSQSRCVVSLFEAKRSNYCQWYRYQPHKLPRKLTNSLDLWSSYRRLISFCITWRVAEWKFAESWSSHFRQTVGPVLSPIGKRILPFLIWLSAIRRITWGKRSIFCGIKINLLCPEELQQCPNISVQSYKWPSICKWSRNDARHWRFAGLS